MWKEAKIAIIEFLDAGQEAKLRDIHFFLLREGIDIEYSSLKNLVLRMRRRGSLKKTKRGVYELSLWVRRKRNPEWYYNFYLRNKLRNRMNDY